MRSLRELDQAEIEVGHFDELHPEDGDATMADVAAWNALGTAKIPARDWITPVTDGEREAITIQQHEILQRITTGRIGVGAGTWTFGQLMVGRMQRSMTDLRTPPNAPSTIKAKGSSNPLIDTGALRNSIAARLYIAGMRRQ